MIQMTELHYRQSPKCDYAAVKARAQKILESQLDSPAPRQVGRDVVRDRRTIQHA
jgi:hypothetical protein